MTFITTDALQFPPLLRQSLDFFPLFVRHGVSLRLTRGRGYVNLDYVSIQIVIKLAVSANEERPVDRKELMDRMSGAAGTRGLWPLVDALNSALESDPEGSLIEDYVRAVRWMLRTLGISKQDALALMAGTAKVTAKDNGDQVDDIDDIEQAIAEFKERLPGWWFTVGSCSVSRDASCAPDIAGPDADLCAFRLFDQGFHYDDADPESTVASSLRKVTADALLARAVISMGWRDFAPMLALWTDELANIRYELRKEA